MRTTETEVTFRNAFSLSALKSPQPAGTYRVVVDEEQIGGLSFIAYRRTATMLHTPAIGTSALPRQVFQIDPAELASAMKAEADAETGAEKSKGI